LYAAGRQHEAHQRHSDALALAEQIGDRYEKAHALCELAKIMHNDADLEGARRYQQQASTIYAELGIMKDTAD